MFVSGGINCFHMVHPPVSPLRFGFCFLSPCMNQYSAWFLLLVLLNNLRNLLIFCINVDIDKMLLLQKNEGLGINSFRIISLCYL